ncbi:hypothetical protein C8N40_101566 [Pontibacter mucosus]|uniref:Uncharacterized protein n=1 Tax=Pontibacter mucosus TaxID=1649266 RepID=A0A2T5YTU4_9BACT|nr:hypothetical protein C8N40_101566 [Pontibacter mucosus]
MHSKRTTFISLLITYVLVKVVHNLAGFEYAIFSEGILNLKFLVDMASWAIVYAAVYFLLRKLLPQRGATAG